MAWYTIVACVVGCMVLGLIVFCIVVFICEFISNTYRAGENDKNTQKCLTNFCKDIHDLKQEVEELKDFKRGLKKILK